MARRRLLTIGWLLVGVALVAAGCTIPTTKDGGGYGPSGAATSGYGGSAPAPVRLRSGVPGKLSGQDSSWSTTQYQAAAGAKVVLDIANHDRTQHNFTLEGVGVSKNIPADGRTEVRFTTPGPGRYRFWCKYHQQEMQGWLTIQ
jgi:plastocyanin